MAIGKFGRVNCGCCWQGHLRGLRIGASNFRIAGAALQVLTFGRDLRECMPLGGLPTG